MTNQVENREQGFGILETAVTIALLTLIIAATVPFLLQSVSALQLAADAQNIASELQLAKFKASSQSTPYQVVLDTEGNTVKLQKRSSIAAQYTDEGGAKSLASTTQYILTPNSVPAGAPMSLSTPIRFNTHGVPIDNNGAPTGNNAVYLGNGGTTMYAITVALSGKIQMWWYDGTQWTTQ